MKDLTHRIILLCVLMMSVFLIGFSIVWAVDIKGTVANDNIMGTATDVDMRGFRGNDVLNGLAGGDGMDVLDGAWVMMRSTAEVKVETSSDVVLERTE